MKTLYAERIGTFVALFDENLNHKATFPRRGYRPTKATKIVTVNGWKYNLKWREIITN